MSGGIRVVHNPSPSQLQALGVRDWPIWAKETSLFPWHYHEAETCYFLAGEVIVTPDEGAPIRMCAGDLVTFPAGLGCTWQILSDVRKHYRFE